MPLLLPRDPSTFSEGDWRHSYVGFEGPVVPSEKGEGTTGSLGTSYYNNIFKKYLSGSAHLALTYVLPPRL